MPPNRMKDTRCKICNKDLNNYSFEQMMKHKQYHIQEEEIAKDQTQLSDF